jgi:SPP1 gp7 family putative phage head morphogenesis protein
MYSIQHTCNHVHTLADDAGDLFISDAELEAWVRDIYTNGKGTLHMPTVHKLAQHFYSAVLNGYGNDFNSLDLNSPDAIMLSHLLNNCYTFSAAKNKTHLQQLTALINNNGRVREWASYYSEAQKLNLKLHKTWLKTEYDLAIAGATMASKWIQFESTPDALLRYSTVGDARVRAEHWAMHGTTLPSKHPFWDKAYPPNGFKCRCDVDRLPYSATATPADKIPPTGTDEIPAIFQTNLGKAHLVFPPKHPYYVTNAVEADASLVPSNLDKYQAVHNNEINTTIFNYLNRPTALINSKRDSGAYYSPSANEVHIPLNRARVQRSPNYYLPNVMYHEYGHAIQFHYKLHDYGIVHDVMNKYRNLFAADKDKLYKQIDKRLYALGEWAYEKQKFDLVEMVGAAQDTLASLDPRYGAGHPAAYWKLKDAKESEFIAHMFENAFGGNPVFKKVMPDLYDDMLALWEQIKIEVIQK